MSRKNRNRSQVEESQVDDEDEELDDEDETEDSEEVEGETYTYVGGGESSPNKIKFMGKQEFIRGKATVVSDASLIKKIESNPCFVKGSVKAEVLHEMDEAANQKADAQRGVDRKLNEHYQKAFKGEK